MNYLNLNCDCSVVAIGSVLHFADTTIDAPLTINIFLLKSTAMTFESQYLFGDTGVSKKSYAWLSRVVMARQFYHPIPNQLDD